MKTADKTKGKEDVAQQAPATQLPVEAGSEAAKGMRLRLPYPRAWCESYGISPQVWAVICDTIYPNALSAEIVCMVIAYCRARNLDIMKKPVHIVPIYSKPLDRMVEGFWPSIAEVRITATRTGDYAGVDDTEFGPEITKIFTNTHANKTTEKLVVFPEWARVTVYKMVQGVRCPFKGPKVRFDEAYATENKWSEVPNDMWATRPSGQLEKCAEAAALRKAFPEELGSQQTADEMYGRAVDHGAPAIPKPLLEGEIKPGNAKGSEFARKPAPAAQPIEAEVVEDARVQDVIDVVDTTEMDGILAAGLSHLPEAMTSGQLVELRDKFEQELPPESDQLSKWYAACEARQTEILETMKGKKP